MSAAGVRRLLRSALPAGALVLLAAPANAGWQEAQWGMTAEQVADAMSGKAPLDRGRRGDRLGGREIRNVGEHEAWGARFRAVYYYDEAGLSQVSLNRKSGDCEAIAAALVAEHGNPTRISDQTIFRVIIWNDETARNQIRLLRSKSICDVAYERLAD